MKRHGELTAQIGELLSRGLKGRGYAVHYEPGVSVEDAATIVSWYQGKDEYCRECELSQLDMAVIDERAHKTVLLIEIEEANDRPKTFLGDLFAALLGDGIRFAGSMELAVDEQTGLLIVGVSRFPYEARNQYIEEKVNAAKANLGTGNARIGRVLIRTFSSEEELKERLLSEVEGLLREREAA